jgi:hypothetical protein
MVGFGVRFHHPRIAIAFAIAATANGHPAALGAQKKDTVMASHDSTRASLRVGAQAVALATRLDPGPANRTYSEGYIAQPMIMLHGGALNGHLGAVLTLDFEGLTLERGQLTPGAYGEGYADRRHPHTYLHEGIVVARGAFGGLGVSVAGGKGFVPFGTDDPMMRPFAAYPVNHHLAQILERYVAIAAVRRGPVILEGAVFNGDEPVSPGAPPDASRFGDSWSLRATLTPLRSVELEGSFASVKSPEIAGGGGRDQRKWSIGARLPERRGRVRDALVEWARTDEVVGDVRASRFTSFLAEGSASIGPAVLSARYENTTRPEEERLLDPFRLSRTPTDLAIIGITRWRTGTMAVSTPISIRRVAVAPFVEVTHAHPSEEVSPSAFVPRDFYGTTSIWSASIGVRVALGTMIHRMGRYGVAMPNAPAMAKPADHQSHFSSRS